MPNYQNSSVDDEKLTIGNYKIETAASAGGTFINLGAGIVNSSGHNITKFDVQAGNAPDPVEGISDEDYQIDFEMIEYDASVLSAISCGAMTHTATSVLSTLKMGGNSTLTERAFRLTNTRLNVSGSTTVETILTVYKATLETGVQFTYKSDNDADPVNVMPATIIAKPDTTRASGNQLATITRTLIP